MRQGPNLFFNVVTVIFLGMTLVVGLIILGVAIGSMESPILVPEDTDVPPTALVIPTLTPSPTPTEDTRVSPTAPVLPTLAPSLAVTPLDSTPTVGASQ